MLCAYDCYVNIMRFDYTYVHRAGRLLVAYDLGVATPRELVYAGVMTSRDARSWYMISKEAKLWDLSDFAYIHCHIAQLSNCLKYWHNNWVSFKPMSSPALLLTFLSIIFRGGGRAREPRRRNVKPTGEPEGQGNDQRVEINRDMEGVPDFPTTIVQQFHNLLHTILAQVSHLGNDMNQNGDAINDNT
nr:hypothetical protein [Tanacetum cinerariifolium]